MVLALAATPVLLIAAIWDSPQLRPLRHHPLVGGLAILAALALVGGLAVVIRRFPNALPLLAVATLPFRVPISSGGNTSNLLVPLYAVVAAGTLAYIVRRPSRVARPKRASRRSDSSSGRWSAWSGSTRSRRATRMTSPRPSSRSSSSTSPSPCSSSSCAESGGRSRLLLACLGVLVGLALVFVSRRLRRVLAPRAPAQPEGDQREHGRVVLPRQLAVLRPEHLRPLPGRRDAARRDSDALGPATARDPRAAALPGRALGRR